MIKPLKIQKSALNNEPYLIWNSFIHLIALSDIRKMNDIQMIPTLSFRYDSEVQNGGHLQFFENSYRTYKDFRTIKILVNATLDALKALGAHTQAEILSKASDLYLKNNDRNHPKTVEEYCSEALENEFGEYDDRYYDCKPDIQLLLEEYLQKHPDEFVKII
jgi:hypothetical protein